MSDGSEVHHGPLLDVRHLVCSYASPTLLSTLRGRQPTPVVFDVSFSIEPQQVFALVGESGSGKSTIARVVAGLLRPLGGELLFDGQDMGQDAGRRNKSLRHQIQLILQNPDASLNPRHKVSYIIGRPLEYFFGIKGAEQRRRVEQLLDDVRLDGSYAERYPAQLSGGERQRVAIARALAGEPSLLLCDEVLSALDVSVQAGVLELLRALQQERKITYLFISHDLAVVRWFAHHVGVLYRGQLCEVGAAEDVFCPPYHPYTEMLLLAVPEPDPEQGLTGRPLADPDSGERHGLEGCPFAPRCPRRVGTVCDEHRPPWSEAHPGHAIRCHIPAAELLSEQR